MADKVAQSRKALLSIVLKADPIQTCCNAEHCLNASLPIVTSPLGKCICFNEEQPIKHFSGMAVIASLKTTSDKDLQFANALFPISRTECGIVILSKYTLFAKALSSIA